MNTEYTKAEILHATPMNHFCESGKTYVKIGEVDVLSLNHAFVTCQNGIHPKNPYNTFKVRSLSVGDIVRIDGVNHMVKGIGFEEVPDEFFKIKSDTVPSDTQPDSK
jgi:hypothetical protein